MNLPQVATITKRTNEFGFLHGKTQLVGIQILRGIAAFIVVLDHVQDMQVNYFPGVPPPPDWLGLGRIGVDLFFVISGFIMMYVTAKPLNSWRQQAAFLIRRLVRIYPVYWAVVLPTILIFLVFPVVMAKTNRAPDIFASIFLLPHRAAPDVLTTAWTLVYEIYFYCVASFIFRWHGRMRLCLLGAWAAFIVVANLIQPWVGSGPYQAIDSAHESFFAPYLSVSTCPLGLEFIAGAILANILQKSAIRIPQLLAGGVVAVAVATIFLQGIHNTITYYPAWRVFLFGIPSLVVVWMVLQMEIQGNWLWLKFIAPVGDRSYSLYLLHVPLIAIVFKIASRHLHLSSVASVFAATLFSLICLAVLVEIYYRLIEKTSHNAARRLARSIEQKNLEITKGSDFSVLNNAVEDVRRI